MKNDKEIIVLFIICSFFQAIFFRYIVTQVRPFAFAQGISLGEYESLPYLEICVLVFFLYRKLWKIIVG